jgi:hypothetical protein
MVKNHIKMEKPDGNGFHGGLRLSAAAVASIIALLSLTFAVYTKTMNRIHIADLRAEDVRDASYDQRFCGIEESIRDMKADVKDVRTEIKEVRDILMEDRRVRDR